MSILEAAAFERHAPQMIFACTKHVKEALKMMYLPHVHVISNQDKLSESVRCHICVYKAHYMLFNYLQDLKNVI
ncbi:hypothetical protein AF332_15765 [Sporosarcina globispora]|uniref:Uncharacterized protein n=1 Tax=Sporosarcina globispora TaxID=1459 RepID=A0A0M0GFA5_SPOGL|nr:hypothetical protein AF332_15765 [Sporosarcina globispora]